MEGHPPPAPQEPLNKGENPKQPLELPPDDLVPPPPSPEKKDGVIMNYRGIRTYSVQFPLKVRNVKCSRVDENTIVIEIAFNQSIDPRSIKKASILIDGEEIEKSPRFFFNKKGDTVKFELAFCKDEFELKMQGICSFDGSVMENETKLIKVEE